MVTEVLIWTLWTLCKESEYEKGSWQALQCFINTAHREVLALNPERYGLTDTKKTYNLAGKFVYGLAK